MRSQNARATHAAVDEFGPCSLCGRTIRARHEICRDCVALNHWRPTDFGYSLTILSARPVEEAK